MPLSFPVLGGNPQADGSAVRPPVITGNMATSQTYAIPHVGQGTVIDAGGSGNHLPPSWFSQGNRGVAIPTGGSGLGSPGLATQAQPCEICSVISDNLIWVVIGVVVLAFILMAVL